MVRCERQRHRIAAAEIDHLLGHAATSPVAAAIVAGGGGPEAGAVAEDIEVLVQERIAVAVQADKSEWCRGR
jgi:hypothetical protein